MESSVLDELLPYREWRPGQKELARAVEETVLESKILLARYPVGIGKTIAVLIGAIAAGIPKIIYLARTKNQFQAPFREIVRLAAAGIRIPAVLVTSKQDLCLLDTPKNLSYKEFLLYCLKARKTGKCGYKLHATIKDIPDLVDTETAKNIGKSEGVCPFELVWSMLPRVRVIVASYSYLFDKDLFNIFLSKGKVKLDESFLVVDEAHNLPYYISSASQYTITEYTLIMSRKELQTLKRREISSTINRISMFLSYVRKKAKQLGDREVELDMTEVLSILPSSGTMFALANDIEGESIETSFTRKIAEFTKALESASHDYVLSLNRTLSGYELKLSMYNVSRIAQRVFSSVRSAILMSATLPPKEHIVALLGLNLRKIDELIYPYIWADNVSMRIIKGISSRYVERSKETFQRYARFVDKVFRKSGNTLVVFPSYSFLRSTYVYLKSRPVIVEDENTSIKEVMKSLLQNPKSLILAAAWGKLIEGVEFRLKGRSLIDTVIIVGLPVPEPSLINRKLLDYLSIKLEDREKAWKMVYLYPGLIKIVQAIGRGVRSEKDKIKAYIVDDRVAEDGVNYLMSYGFNVKIEDISSYF